MYLFYCILLGVYRILYYHMMTVKQIFDLGIEMGIAADPRGKKAVAEYISRAKKEYEKATGSEKEYFDTERLTNPYIDSTIHVNDGKTKVKRIMAGIDINSADILVASQLAERGTPVDLVIAHHPIGKAIARLHDVMDLQTDIYHAEGMPIHLAEKIMDDRICEVGRGVHGMNHYQVVDVARILGINLINTHTITDNMVDEYIRLYLEKKNPYRIGELIDALMEIPEYQIATRQGAGPTLFAGSPKHRTGKFIVEMTGGTEPSNKLYEHFSRMGISTHDVLAAAQTKWNFLPFTPGLVGGHCIGVDPYYLTYKAKQIGYESKVILAGREINDTMHLFFRDSISTQLQLLGKDIKGSTIALFGATFKENVPDVRNSRIMILAQELQLVGAQVYVCDPYASTVDVQHEYGIVLTDQEDIPPVDVLLFGVSHNEYKTITPADLVRYQKEGEKLVCVDIKNMYDRQGMEQMGFIYWSL